MVAAALLVIGVVLSGACAFVTLMLFAVSRHYHPEGWAGPVLFGSIGALLIIAVTVHLHVCLARWRKRSADRRIVMAGIVVGAIMTLGAISLALLDRGDYFVYLPFALAGVVLLAACRLAAGWTPREAR